MKSTKIFLIITNDNYPDGDAGAVRIHAFAKMIAEAGFNTLVIGMGDASGFQIKEFDGIPFYSLRYASKNILSRICGRLFFKRNCKVVIKKYKISEIGGIMYVSGSAALLRDLKRMSKEYSIPLYFDSVEWYSPCEFAAGVLNPVYIKNNRLNSKLIDGSFRVFTISRFLEDYFSSKSIPTLRVPVIMDMDRIKFRANYAADNGNGKINIVYAGSPGKKDHLREMVSAIGMLNPEEADRICFTVIGITLEQYEKHNGKTISAVCGQSIVFKGRQKRDTVLELTHNADFSYLLRPSGERYAKAGFPTKAVESIACGTPMLCNFSSDLQLYLKDGVNSIIIESCSADSCLKALKRILRLKPDELSALRKSARQTAETFFDRRIYAAAVSDFISKPEKPLMKVLQIGGTFVSAQKVIEGAIHDYLTKHGYESHILYAVGESDDKNIICYENRLENLFRRFMSRLFGGNPHYTWLQTQRIIRYIKRLSPDVVNLHVLHHGYVDYISLLNFLAKEQIPAVFTMHDMWGATGGCYHYTNSGCSEYKSGCRRCQEARESLDCRPGKTAKCFSIKFRLYSRLKNPCFIAVSPWVHDELMNTELSRYPLSTIWNSADLPKDFNLQRESAEIKRSEKFTVIGVAACWDKRKGLHRFLKLAEMLGDSYEVILVGTVGDAVKQTAPKNIVFKGCVSDRAALFSLYAAADLHISMSLEETFGLTFVEAALAGTKSMGFDSTAIPYVIEKTYGFVIQKHDVSEMANEIRRLANCRSLCKLTDDERLSVKAFFSPERMAEEYCSVYEKAYLLD